MRTRNIPTFIAIILFILMMALSACASPAIPEDFTIETVVEVLTFRQETISAADAQPLIQTYVDEHTNPEIDHIVTEMIVSEESECGWEDSVEYCRVQVEFTLDGDPDWHGHCDLYTLLPDICVAYLRGG